MKSNVLQMFLLILLSRQYQQSTDDDFLLYLPFLVESFSSDPGSDSRLHDKCADLSSGVLVHDWENPAIWQDFIVGILSGFTQL